MGLFNRLLNEPKPILQPSAATELASIGRAAFPPRLTDRSQIPDYHHYFTAALDAHEHPRVDTPEFEVCATQLFEELIEIAENSAGSWALPGAFWVGFEFGIEYAPPAYFDLVDQALLFLRDEGASRQNVPPFAMGRWIEAHGIHAWH